MIRYITVILIVVRVLMTLRTALLGLIGREPSTAYPSNTDNLLVKVGGGESARGQSFMLVKEVHLYGTFFAFNGRFPDFTPFYLNSFLSS